MAIRVRDRQHDNDGVFHLGADERSRNTVTKELIGIWKTPARLTENNFVYKSLSNWALNVAVGCRHGCGFCFVPKVSTKKLLGSKDAPGPLAKLGVVDADAQWGEYVYVREFDENVFRQSLRAAENTPREKLNPDGNRAVILCSTTDAYQVTADRETNERLAKLVRRSLQTILEQSTINVRILTRGPLAKRDFDLMRAFGNRLTFGMSLPTLNDRLARVYEEHAPAPSQRLKTLRAAKDAGLHVFVAVAPTYPEQDEQALFEVLDEVRKLEPITVYHEPINERAGNVKRMRELAAEAGIEFAGDKVFASQDAAAEYQIAQLRAVERIAKQIGLGNRLHLWPDKSLGSAKRIDAQIKKGDTYFERWLNITWRRVSEWPS